MSDVNRYGQPVGAPMAGWQARPLPDQAPMQGEYCVVEPLDAARHGPALAAAFAAPADDRDWTYLADERPADAAAYAALFARLAASRDPMHHAIVDRRTGSAAGAAAFMRLDPANGVIEIGAIRFSPLLQRRRAATEALFLMMRRAFDELGYRRLEWKCDALNAPSRAAAARLGFRFEGVFRQAVVVKGRNRDTAWYAMLDREWPQRRLALQEWLSPENFDADGRQRRPLARP